MGQCPQRREMQQLQRKNSGDKMTVTLTVCVVHSLMADGHLMIFVAGHICDRQPSPDICLLVLKCLAD